MKKSDWKEVIDKTGKWLGTHKKPAVLTCLAAAAVAAAAGVILCALRSAPLPTDTAAAQRVISIAMSEEAAGGSEALSRSSSGSVTSSGSSAADVSESEASFKVTAGPKKERDKTEKPEFRESTKSAAESAGSTGSGTEESRPRTEKAEEVTATEQPGRQEDKRTEKPEQPEQPEKTISQHEHNWEPVTVTVHRDAVTHTVHHDAETEIVHHDPVTHEEPVYEYRTICNTCGEDITGQIPDHIGPVCQGSYSVQQVQTGVNIVTDTEAFDEEVVTRNAWDETVVDQEARDETITVGWRCSVCGQMKD